ncbi:MAG TPA: dolichyl-phosphate beta-glucosyltransferase [Candidatus Paceibacterota bacterium]
MYLSIIIPCYNEEKRLGKTLSRIHDFMSSQSYSYEVIVVDNGSKDKTAEIANSFQNKIPTLKVILRKSHGKGWAVKQGMLEAVGEYRLFTDADNSTDISQVDKLISYAKSGYDVVISSRKAKGAVLVPPQPFHRIWLGNIFAFTVRHLLPLGDIKDTQNGFKLFTAESATKIFRHQSIYYWAFDVEILTLAKAFGYKIVEVPIVWVNDERSKMNLKGMMRMAFEVFLIRLHFFTFDYSKLGDTPAKRLPPSK